MSIIKNTVFRALCCATLSAFAPSLLMAETQSVPLWPNEGGITLMTPSGWGASNGMVFLGVGRITPQENAEQYDTAACAGIGFGNPEKNLGVELCVVADDAFALDNHSVDFKLHRIISTGTSIAFGGEHLFYDKTKSDLGNSFYIALSHAVQGLPSSTNPDQSQLQFSLGIGNGRFSHKSTDDVIAGKGTNGTHVFGAVAYEMLPATNMVVEWSGVNLNAGLSTGFLRLGENVPLNVTVAAGDLTRNSGNGVILLSSASIAVLF